MPHREARSWIWKTNRTSTDRWMWLRPGPHPGWLWPVAVLLGFPIGGPAWALGWLVTSYVITTNVKEQFAVFGGSGALVFGVLTWLLLAFLLGRPAPDSRRAPVAPVR